MRTIEFTGQYKRDYKREKKGQRGKTLEADLTAIISDLVADNTLDAKYKDHGLSGEWKDCRDCHVHPDLVLIYRKVDPPTVRKPKIQEPKSLQLLRLGSHGELNL
jgi:mRNA interferase YafQ